MLNDLGVTGSEIEEWHNNREQRHETWQYFECCILYFTSIKITFLNSKKFVSTISQVIDITNNNLA